MHHYHHHHHHLPHHHHQPHHLALHPHHHPLSDTPKQELAARKLANRTLGGRQGLLIMIMMIVMRTMMMMLLMMMLLIIKTITLINHPPAFLLAKLPNPRLTQGELESRCSSTLSCSKTPVSGLDPNGGGSPPNMLTFEMFGTKQYFWVKNAVFDFLIFNKTLSVKGAGGHYGQTGHAIKMSKCSKTEER